jgi:hypothetical protein
LNDGFSAINFRISDLSVPIADRPTVSGSEESIMLKTELLDFIMAAFPGPVSFEPMAGHAFGTEILFTS